MNTQVRKDHVAAVYFINLLISNLIQLCCMTVLLTVNDVTIVLFLYIFQGFALMTSVYLMLCIALERCSFIISPRCSCFRQVMEIPVVVCFLFWVPSLFWLCRLVYSDLQIKEIILAFLLFLPFPLFILSLGGTLKALCAASRVPPDEKRRTVAIQVLLLLIYTLLFLPFAIWSLTDGYFHSILHYVIFTAVRFIPLANVGVYLFLRKGAADKFLSCVCRCTVDNSEISSRVNDDTVIAVSSV
ncbi:hypothetical protein Q5P01_021826 [Channa striata]|uniref:G-protein coupled receptors family 1 profile domain-containing protein n=1 Tax=Channa striata TaxID=64152 RepID=A0AA88LUX6_CHASR|nr:hypothetical protein Q5P01_021826 [Channa striata]